MTHDTGKRASRGVMASAQPWCSNRDLPFKFWPSLAGVNGCIAGDGICKAAGLLRLSIRYTQGPKS